MPSIGDVEIGTQVLYSGGVCAVCCSVRVTVTLQGLHAYSSTDQSIHVAPMLRKSCYYTCPAVWIVFLPNKSRDVYAFTYMSKVQSLGLQTFWAKAFKCIYSGYRAAAECVELVEWIGDKPRSLHSYHMQGLHICLALPVIRDGPF